jgi:protein-S-isoprenylcysteine O-methyltransferase Ste14
MVDSQDHAQVRFPPPILTFLHVLAAMLLQWLLPFPPHIQAALRWLGLLLVIAGLWLSLAAVRRFLAAHTTLDPHHPVSVLVTGGPYRLSRNPIYLGFLLTVAGLPLALGTYWGIVLALIFPLVMDQLVIRAEETYLLRRFQDQYAEYQSQVRRWI